MVIYSKPKRMKRRRSTVMLNGEEVRRVREAKGWSQEKLAAMSNMHKRTVQRAEAGNPVARETVSFMAEALEVQVDQLYIRDTATDDTPRVALGEVVLIPTISGRKIINEIRRCSDVRIDYEVEPTSENIDLLSMLHDHLNGKLPLSEIEILRRQASLNGSLEKLSDLEIRVFLATYWADREVIHYDPYEPHQMTGQDQEHIEVVYVIISDAKDDHMVRRPDDLSDVPF